ncbi:transposase [Pseudanabaenaceae cyanobacterium LEGE 13415]|nr:transposase [Pseudanabaenaceae cyanobacterium LEGE 13415]
MFTTILVVCGKVNFTNLSRYSYLHERTYRRQFEKAFDFIGLNLSIVADATATGQNLLGVMDSSFIRKSGKTTFGLDWYYNGSASQVEKGLEVSLIGLVNIETEQGYAVCVEQTCSSQDFPEFTRIDQAIDQVRRLRPQLPTQVRHFAVDGLYVKQKFVTGMRHLNLHLISKLRRDANLRYLFEGVQKPRGRRRTYAGKVNLTDPTLMHCVEELEPDIALYTAVVWHVSLQCRIRLAYLHDTRNAQSPKFALLFSTDLDLCPKDLIRLYRLRFQIEFLFRDSKQFTGLEDCQSAHAKKLDFHFNSSLSTLNLAKLQAWEERDPDQPFVFSMASLKRRALNDFLLDAFISKLELSPTSIKSHPNYESLRDYGVIAA